MGGLKKSSFLVMFLFFKSIFFLLLPYVVVQTVLRISMTILSIKHLFSSQGLLIPFSFLSGFIYDVICGAQIGLCVIMLLLIIPYHLRVSLVGKLLSFFIIFLFSFFIISVFFTEISLWWNEGVRFYGGFFSYFADFASVIRRSHGSYGWYSSGLLLVLILGVSFSLCRFIVSKNIFGKYVFINLSQVEATLCVVCMSAFLIACDLFHSRFDIVSYIRSGRTISSENRYINEIAKNGLFESITKSLSSLWPFEDLYLSIPEEKKDARSALLRLGAGNENTIFVDNDSDIYAPQGLRLYRSASSEKRYNVIVVMLEDFAQKKGGRIERGNISGMPYLSMLSERSMFFENFHAISARKSESLFALLFSLVPLRINFDTLRGDLFSLPNVFKAYGYETQSFHDRFHARGDELKIFLAAGFVANSMDVYSKSAKEVKDVKEHQKRVEFDGRGRGGRDEAAVFIEDALERADKAHDNGANFFYALYSSFFDADKKNNARTIDDNIKRLFETSKERPWFNETIFVFVGVNAGKNIAGTPIDPGSHLTPFLIVKPDSDVGELESQPVGSLDFATILTNAMGIKYISKFQGIDPVGSKKSGPLLLKSGEFIGYIRGSKMGIMAPYKRWNLYEKRLKHEDAGISVANLEKNSHNSYYYVSAPIAGINPMDLLNSDDWSPFGMRRDCRYQNVSWDGQSMSWRSGRIYKKYISKSVAKKKKESAKTYEMFMLEMIAAVENNAIAQRNMESIKYNILLDDAAA